MAKKNRNDLADRIAAVPVHVLLAVTRALPYRARLGLGAFIGRQIVLRSRSLRQRIEQNLAHVLPDLAPEERARVVRGTGDNFGRTFIEILHSEKFVRQGRILPPSGPGADAILAAAEAGTGAVLVSGHFGQWEGCRVWMRRNGINCAGVYRPTENPYVNALYSRGLAGCGTPMFEKGRRGMRGLVAHLAKRNVVAVLIDQYDRRAQPLDFLGRPAPTSTAAAELALKYKVPLIPIVGYRLDDGVGVQVEADPPVAHTTPQEMMQQVNDALAAHVRAHPGQYYWLHRRWSKSLPELAKAPPSEAAPVTAPTGVPRP
jgi:Kdo2-lipid IVA lauroyltransferase/acyltransferase